MTTANAVTVSRPSVGVGFTEIDMQTARANNRAELKYRNVKHGTWSVNWHPTSMCLWSEFGHYVFHCPSAT
jgi:hypothetical protein